MCSIFCYPLKSIQTGVTGGKHLPVNWTIESELLKSCSYLTQKLCPGLVRVQRLRLLHVLRHHGNPLLRLLLFEKRCGDVLG